MGSHLCVPASGLRIRWTSVGVPRLHGMSPAPTHRAANTIEVPSLQLDPTGRGLVTSERYLRSRVHCKTIGNGQTEATGVTVTRGVAKEDVTRRHNGTLFGHERGHPAICHKDGPRGRYAE